MKRLYTLIGTMLLCGAMMLPLQSVAQTNSRGAQVSTTSRQSNQNKQSAPSRPGGGNQGTRPGGGNQGNRPGGGNQGNRPGSGNRPNNGGQGFNPGHNHTPQPGRPGGVQPTQPGRPGGHGGNSAPRPGTGGVPTPPGGYGYHRPPGIPSHPVWDRPLPPAPPRYTYTRVGVPTIGGLLGLTFGTFIDYGLSQLFNAGHNIVSAIDNAIYLNNVNQFGIMWPQATIYYGSYGMNGARFQYPSYSPGDYRFNSVYNQLCGIYGAPVSNGYTNGMRTATWWGGGNTGYITLQYGPGVNQNGARMYYTDLIYGY